MGLVLQVSSMNNIQDTYSNFIILRTYSRWLEDKQRRETWQDSVYRYRDFLLPKVPDSLKDDFLEAVEAVIRKEIMPSMRLLWTAGKAAEIDNVSAYNCAYTPIDKINRFFFLIFKIRLNSLNSCISSTIYLLFFQLSCKFLPSI